MLVQLAEVALTLMTIKESNQPMCKAQSIVTLIIALYESASRSSVPKT